MHRALLYYLAPKQFRNKLRVKSSSAGIDIVSDETSQVIRLDRRNAVYILDMMTAFNYYFSSADPICLKLGKKNYMVTDFSTPRFQKISGFPDFPVMCPSLTEPFITAQQYMDFAGLTPGNVVIDLGTYSALTAIAFSKCVGETGKIIAIEPDPANYSASKINVAQHALSNKLENIRLLNIAVSAESGFLSFSSESAMGSSEVGIVGSYRGDNIQVECLTLSDIVTQNNLSRVDFIKMDIEGSEEKVISSSRGVFE